jgi:uncharacterized protein YneR
LAALQAFHEAFDLAGGIDDALFARVVGVTSVRISGSVLPVVQVAPHEQTARALG